ncbi:hypothetical protein F0562_032495 [Nyssa sinensis]|uniref:Small nuclear ribonucleoprotein Sm D2 n=1 Tax=Nyssa sinensis TaxID=561372 RepID=A0A5J5ARS5_9ASTE|nr:hypothetical protein F0562_032495 [Nyssa sinensis]
MSRPMEEDGGKNEEEEFNTGPLSVLMMSVKNNTQVLINWRCGLRYLRLEKGRKKPNQLTRTDSSVRCFCAETLLSLFLGTQSERAKLELCHS